MVSESLGIGLYKCPNVYYEMITSGRDLKYDKNPCSCGKSENKVLFKINVSCALKDYFSKWP